MPLWFWYWVHDNAEKLWHWTYYRKIKPREKRAELGDILYTQSTPVLMSDTEWMLWTDEGLKKIDSPLREKKDDQNND